MGLGRCESSGPLGGLASKNPSNEPNGARCHGDRLAGPEPCLDRVLWTCPISADSSSRTHNRSVPGAIPGRPTKPLLLEDSITWSSDLVSILQNVGVDDVLRSACDDQEPDLTSVAALDELDEVRTEELHPRTPD